MIDVLAAVIVRGEQVLLAKREPKRVLKATSGSFPEGSSKMARPTRSAW